MWKVVIKTKMDGFVKINDTLKLLKYTKYTTISHIFQKFKFKQRIE
jgi:hypothetical protein